MEQLRPVSKLEKIMFPVIVVIIIAIFLPDAAPLVGMLMLGNLFKESGVVERLSKTAQNELMNIITIFLGTTVGATASGQNFLTFDTIKIIVLGLLAFCMGTAFVYFSVRLCTRQQAVRLTRSSVQQVYPPFRWLPVYLRRLVRLKIPATSSSCTLWVRMLQV